MIITYDEFCNLIIDLVDNKEDFYIKLLENIINNPNRYCEPLDYRALKLN